LTIATRASTHRPWVIFATLAGLALLALLAPLALGAEATTSDNGTEDGSPAADTLAPDVVVTLPPRLAARIFDIVSPTSKLRRACARLSGTPVSSRSSLALDCDVTQTRVAHKSARDTLGFISRQSASERFAVNPPRFASGTVHRITARQSPRHPPAESSFAHLAHASSAAR